MSPQRQLTTFRFLPLRAAAAVLLLAALAQPGAAPLLAAPGLAVPAATGPLAPQSGCGVVVNNSDNAVGSLRWTVDCVAAGATVTFQPSLAGQTIVLTGTEISIAQSITIDGSAAPGVIVDAGNNSRVFNISASGPVTLTALTLQHGNPNGNGAGGAVYASASSALTLIGVKVLSSTVTAGTGGGLFTNGPLALTNSDFISNTSNSIGGAVVAVGVAVVSGGRFERNTCTTGGCSGGALYGFGSLTISGADFISNTSMSSGGAIYANGPAALTNGLVQGNQCTQSGCQGGGLFALSSLTVNGTQFIGNNSAANGAGAYSTGAAGLTGGTFQGNRCTQLTCQGGGLYASNNLTMTSTSFISNTSIGDGGGAQVQDSALVITGRFEQNACTGGCHGGGLWAKSAIITGTQFISNISVNAGGGAWITNGATLTNGRFEQNKCTASGCQGGGLNVDFLDLVGTQFMTNTSAGSGGGVAAFGNSQMVNGLFQGNRCTENDCLGGGLTEQGAAIQVRRSTFTGNQSAGSGGGLAITENVLPLLPANGPSRSNSPAGGDQSAGGDQPAGAGGGINIWLINSTLSGNTATVAGGGLYVTANSHASLLNVTVADNHAPSGGGVATAALSSTVGISNTLFSNNGVSTCTGTLTPGTHNLEFPGAVCAAAGGPGAGFSTGNPQLLPLALNAPGVTLTQALGPDSLARDHGDPTVCASLLVHSLDQRGVARPIDGDLLPGAICDIGAYEAAAPVWLLFLPLLMR